MEETTKHPAFPQPDDNSVNLWRYMDISKFKWLIENSRIFMPSADNLGDPLEGTAPEGHIKWWKREAENATSAEKQRIAVHNRKFQSNMARKMRNNYYVSCWHMNQRENHAMWQCYTTEPESVALKTTYATLRESISKYVEMGVVRYIDYATESLPSMNMFEFIMHKDEYFHFEVEVRAVVLHPPENTFGYDNFKNNHFESESKPGFFVYAPQVQLRSVPKIT